MDEKLWFSSLHASVLLLTQAKRSMNFFTYLHIFSSNTVTIFVYNKWNQPVWYYQYKDNNHQVERWLLWYSGYHTKEPTNRWVVLRCKRTGVVCLQNIFLVSSRFSIRHKRIANISCVVVSTNFDIQLKQMRQNPVLVPSSWFLGPQWTVKGHGTRRKCLLNCEFKP